MAEQLLACVYATVAETLLEESGQVPVSEQGAPSEQAQGNDITAILQQFRSRDAGPSQSVSPSTSYDPQENNWFDDTTVFEQWLQAGGRRGRESGGEWVGVLVAVLDIASGHSGVVSQTMDITQASQLWRSLLATISNDDDNCSTGSADTVRASGINENNDINNKFDSNRPGLGSQAGKQEHIDRFLQDLQSNIALPVPDPEASEGQASWDVMSYTSEESNRRQPEQIMKMAAMGVLPAGQGILRREEVEELQKGDIKLRPYQDELLYEARQKTNNNVLIWLPTGTGKTYIVLKYAEEHLAEEKTRRVAFVVPRVRLARQQYERFQAYLPKYKPHLKCGETSNASNNRQPLSEILKTSRVVVVTGQSLVEAVDREKVSLDQFSLLVLDECHHTRGGHPLRSLMNQYMELKSNPHGGQKILPQIIGLTASPGVGRARGKNVDDAVNYLKQLCARLDVSHICSVRKQMEDLSKYVSVPKTDIRECDKRKVDILKDRLEVLMKTIEERMFQYPDVVKYFKEKSKVSLMTKNGFEAPATYRGQEQYTAWLAKVEKEIKEVDYPDAFYALTAHVDLLKKCQKCLILNEDCDSLGALRLLREEVNTMRKDKPNPRTVDTELFGLFDMHMDHHSNTEAPLDDLCRRPDCRNPKLMELEDLLLKAVKKDDDDDGSEEVKPDDEEQEEEVREEVDGSEMADALSEVSSITSSVANHLNMNVRGMIFVRTLDLSKALLNWMKRHRKLQLLQPGRITGVNAGVKNGGMTKSEVTEVMAKFNAGIFKLVICTSAAEEGLDFKACNLVIRYLYEASMVSMVQTRGRAREQDSRYCVMSGKNTDSNSKEQDNISSEKAMAQAVEKIQDACHKDQQAFFAEIQAIQSDAWNKRWRKDVQQANFERKQLPDGMYRLKCGGCLAPACTSNEIRRLRDTNHVVIGAQFQSKYKRLEQDPTQDGNKRTYDARIPRTGKLSCRNCDHYWGIMVRCVDDGVEYPVLPIISFIVEDSQGARVNAPKWKMAFKVPDITDEDKARHVDPLTANSATASGAQGALESQRDQHRRRGDSQSEINGLNIHSGQEEFSDLPLQQARTGVFPEGSGSPADQAEALKPLESEGGQTDQEQRSDVLQSNSASQPREQQPATQLGEKSDPQPATRSTDCSPYIEQAACLEPITEEPDVLN